MAKRKTSTGSAKTSKKRKLSLKKSLEASLRSRMLRKSLQEFSSVEKHPSRNKPETTKPKKHETKIIQKEKIIQNKEMLKNKKVDEKEKEIKEFITSKNLWKKDNEKMKITKDQLMYTMKLNPSKKVKSSLLKSKMIDIIFKKNETINDSQQKEFKYK